MGPNGLTPRLSPLDRPGIRAQRPGRRSRLVACPYTDGSDQPVEQLTPSLGRQLVNTDEDDDRADRLDAGAVVPSHEHFHEQVATVLEGRLRFVVGTEEYVVEAGESVIVPSGVSHRVEALTDSLVLDVFAPVRDDWVRGDDAYLRASG